MIKKKTNSSSSSEKEKTGRILQFWTEWLEIEPGNNFKLITGDAQSGLTMVTAGAKLTKKYGYESLADYVNQKCGTSLGFDFTSTLPFTRHSLVSYSTCTLCSNVLICAQAQLSKLLLICAHRLTFCQPMLQKTCFFSCFFSMFS